MMQDMCGSHLPIAMVAHLHLRSSLGYDVKWVYSKEIWVLHREYFRYRHNVNTIVFNILFVTKEAKFHLSITIIKKVSLFGYVIYFTPDAVSISCKINNIAK